MTLRVIRDKETKEIRCMWEAPTTHSTPGVTVGEPVIDCRENEEYVELENMTHDGALDAARKNSGIGLEKPLGKIYVYDDRVEASVPAPKPTIAGEIRKARAKNKKTSDAPVTLEEIEAAERALSGR